jgi:hypothetical protein
VKRFTLPARFGSLAQLVEQRPEEPRVPSSSLGGATKETASLPPVHGAFSLVRNFFPYFSKKCLQIVWKVVKYENRTLQFEARVPCTIVIRYVPLPKGKEP